MRRRQLRGVWCSDGESGANERSGGHECEEGGEQAQVVGHPQSGSSQCVHSSRAAASSAAARGALRARPRAALRRPAGARTITFVRARYVCGQRWQCYATRRLAQRQARSGLSSCARLVEQAVRTQRARLVGTATAGQQLAVAAAAQLPSTAAGCKRGGEAARVRSCAQTLGRWAHPNERRERGLVGPRVATRVLSSCSRRRRSSPLPPRPPAAPFVPTAARCPCCGCRRPALAAPRGAEQRPASSHGRWLPPLPTAAARVQYPAPAAAAAPPGHARATAAAPAARRLAAAQVHRLPPATAVRPREPLLHRQLRCRRPTAPQQRRQLRPAAPPAGPPASAWQAQRTAPARPSAQAASRFAPLDSGASSVEALPSAAKRQKASQLGGRWPGWNHDSRRRLRRVLAGAPHPAAPLAEQSRARALRAVGCPRKVAG